MFLGALHDVSIILVDSDLHGLDPTGRYLGMRFSAQAFCYLSMSLDINIECVLSKQDVRTAPTSDSLNTT